MDVHVVLDLMTHNMDIGSDLGDSEIKEIDVFGMPVMGDRIDIADVGIMFAHGAVVNLTASRISDRSVTRIRIFQPDTSISADYGKKT